MWSMNLLCRLEERRRRGDSFSTPSSALRAGAPSATGCLELKLFVQIDDGPAQHVAGSGGISEGMIAAHESRLPRQEHSAEGRRLHALHRRHHGHAQGGDVPPGRLHARPGAAQGSGPDRAWKTSWRGSRRGRAPHGAGGAPISLAGLLPDAWHRPVAGGVHPPFPGGNGGHFPQRALRPSRPVAPGRAREDHAPSSSSATPSPSRGSGIARGQAAGNAL